MISPLRLLIIGILTANLAGIAHPIAHQPSPGQLQQQILPSIDPFSNIWGWVYSARSTMLWQISEPPTAVDDVYPAIAQNGSLVQNAPGVLVNDLPASAGLSAFQDTSPGSGPEHGTVDLNPNGSFTYSPDTNYSGPDFFRYYASDGVSTSTLPATVSITVNQPPAADNDAFTTHASHALIIPAADLLTNDSDSDGPQPMTAVIMSGPSHGTLSQNPDHSFTYTPTAAYSGPDSFLYRAFDGLNQSGNATVSLTVLPPPQAVNDEYGVNEDATLIIPDPGVLGNDSNLGGLPMSAAVVNLPVNGSLEPRTQGGFTYIPRPNYFGDDSFTYRANDGYNLSNLATVVIHIASVNDAPVAAGQALSTNEDNQRSVILTASDIDSTSLSFSVTTQPAHGSLSGSAPNLTYTPAQNYNGSDFFTFIANDGNLNSNTATIQITVNAQNDAPVANAQSVSTLEDVPLAITLSGTDVDQDPLTFTITFQPGHGSLTGTIPNLTYTPALNYNGFDSFKFVVNDGKITSPEATVTITINPQNDAPIAINQNIPTSEDQPVSITLGATDVEFDPLTYQVVTPPSHGQFTGTPPGLEYTPDKDYYGSDTFTFRARDGSLNSNLATINITITPVNDPPVAVNDAYTTAENAPLTVSAAAGVLANDYDIDSSTLTVTLITGPANGTLQLNPNGSFVYTSNPYYDGSDSFTYRTFDGFLYSVPASVNLTITPVNYPPVARPEAYTTDEDKELVTPAPGLLANDTDPDRNAVLTPVLVKAPTKGHLDPAVLAQDGSFSYTPNPDENGTDSFSYYVTDGEFNSGTVTVSLTITPINDAPTGTPWLCDTFTTDPDGRRIPEGTCVVVVQNGVVDENVPGLLADASDVDNPKTDLSVKLVSDPSRGYLTLRSNGSFRYETRPGVPPSDFPDTFTYQVSDGILDSAVITVQVYIVAPFNYRIDWIGPVTNTNTYLVGNEMVPLEVRLYKIETLVGGGEQEILCPECSDFGIRFFYWVGDHYHWFDPLSPGQRTFSIDTSGFTPNTYTQLYAVGTNTTNGEASPRVRILLKHLPWVGPAYRTFIPIGLH